jgi:aspartokinase
MPRLLQIAEDGANVVHPAAARLALDHRVPLYVYSYKALLDGSTGTAVGSGEGHS